jgi:bifunctional DNase/RNase
LEAEKMIETLVKCVIKEPLTSRYLMVLETLCGHYIIPVGVGAFEAESIYTVLNKIESPRPMTYDFISMIINNLEDVNVDRVVVDRFEDGVYKASVYVNCAKAERRIDCRPSDAISLALRMSIPVYVEDDVLCPECSVDRTLIDDLDNSILGNIIDDHTTTFWNT